MGYLDNSGLTNLWKKITDKFTAVNTAINNKLDKSSFYDGYLGWGGKNISSDISPIDAALSSGHSANRAELCRPAGVKIEYSTDSGSNWTDYGASDADKIRLFSAGSSAVFYLGKVDKVKNTSIAIRLRVTMNATNMGLYTNLKKILINYTSNGANDNKVLIEYSNKGSESTWHTVGTYNIGGWSGWNSICAVTGAFGGSDGQTGNKANIRLTFSFTTINSSYNSNPAVLNILLFGTTAWGAPSSFAANGHLYSWDTSGNAAFPANVKANSFNSYTINASVPSDAKFTDTVYTHPTSSGNKHIPSGGSSGQILRWSADGTAVWGADNNTWRGVQNNLTSDATDQSLSAAQGKALKSLVDGKAASSHTHNYAGSSSSGGAATSANKLNTDAGSATQPVYFSDGKPVATTYALREFQGDGRAQYQSSVGLVPAAPRMSYDKKLSLLSDGTWGLPLDATTSTSGLMSSADKSKLDGIATGATKVTVDASLSSTSTNPVQNKVIYNAIQSNSGSINLILKNGTTKPTSASDKTVWVNTAITLTDYVLSTEQPTSTKSGLVWIKTNTYGTGLQIGKTIYYLYNAAVCNGSKWDSVEAWLYTTVDGWKQFSTKLVPLDYQAVEYLQGNSSNYIQTNIIPTSTGWGFELTVETSESWSSSASTVGRFFGIVKDKNYFYCNSYYGGQYYIGNTNAINWFGGSTNKKVTMKLHKGIGYNVNGEATKTFDIIPLSYATTLQGLTIFTSINEKNEISSAISKAKIYNLKFFDENDKLIANFIPCYRKSDLEPGMWESIGQKFYASAAGSTTSKFIVGADIA